MLRQRIVIYAPLAQLVEHLTLNQGVQGSNPWRCTCEVVRHKSLSFTYILIYAPLAQLVEHLTLNQGVEGSNPSSRTKALFLVDFVAGDGVFLLFKSYIVL